MDPIQTLKLEKDSTLAMIAAAQRRGWQVAVMEVCELYLKDGRAGALARSINGKMLECGPPVPCELTAFDVIFMRKDPPVDLDYVTATFVLEKAEQAGVLVVNCPQALRDANEKVFATQFPQCCPESLVSASGDLIRDFLGEHGCIVLKPLDQMGGRSVYVLDHSDRNLSVVLEDVTQRGRRFVQAQRYLPEVQEAGDRRILLIDGEPVPYALVRHPKPGETRANLAAGGIPSGALLTERERWICAQLAPELKRRGLFFVGIDVIGDWLTEINVTSPTGIRELDKFFDLDIAGDLLSVIEKRVASSKG